MASADQKALNDTAQARGLEGYGSIAPRKDHSRPKHVAGSNLSRLDSDQALSRSTHNEAYDDVDDHRPLLPTSRTLQSASNENKRPEWFSNFHALLSEELDVGHVVGWIPLCAYCFMTGYIDVITLTACFVWCAFQTGNTIQLGLATANAFSSRERREDLIYGDLQALTSLVAFLFGAVVARIGDSKSPASKYINFGSPKTRGWLVVSTLAQTLLTVGSAICAIDAYVIPGGVTGERGGTPSWTNLAGFATLALASTSMGIQGMAGTRLISHFATTVVLTSTWINLVSDSAFFPLTRLAPSRDSKALSILALFIGGIAGRSVMMTFGAAPALAVAAGIRLAIAAMWFIVPAKKS